MHHYIITVIYNAAAAAAAVATEICQLTTNIAHFILLCTMCGMCVHSAPYVTTHTAWKRPSLPYTPVVVRFRGRHQAIARLHLSCLHVRV